MIRRKGKFLNGSWKQPCRPQKTSAPGQPALRAYVDTLLADKLGGFDPGNSAHAHIKSKLMGSAWFTPLDANGILTAPEDIAIAEAGDHAETMSAVPWERKQSPTPSETPTRKTA